MSSANSSLRLRVFAGPNGSGKSTIINAVRNYKVKDIPVDFGIYVNADDIARTLREQKFSFQKYKLYVSNQEFIDIALASGLVNQNFPEQEFSSCYQFADNAILLVDTTYDEHLAQILADFLRKKLLKEKKKFSFETVFSHESKLDIMKQASKAGYKVYLYFVSTESPETNKYRVKARAAQGGHDVPPNKIVERYYRSLDFLYEACQLVYQAYFFDNSKDRGNFNPKEGEDFRPFAHFKLVNGEKQWDPYEDSQLPDWFIKYYYNKAISPDLDS